jgi:hypothetical protein
MGELLKKTFVNAINAGQAIDDIFIVRDKQIAFKKETRISP